MSWQPRTAWAIAAFFTAALILYWGALRNALVFDDVQLTERVLRSYASSPFRFDLRWFSYVTFGWVYEAFGRDWFWQRLANVLLHAAIASTLFLFLRRLLAALLPQDQTVAAWHALFGALLFLAHPAAVYGVAYLMQRSVLMATLFALLSLRLFLEGLLRSRWHWFIASAAAYFVAVFSKEHCVMLPAVAAALALLVRGWSFRNLRQLALPFALYAAIALLVTLKAKGLLGARYEPFAEALVRQFAESDRAADQFDAYPLSVLNQGFLFFRYLATWLLPWPGWMSIDVRPVFPSHLMSWPQAAGFAAWLAWPATGTALLLRRGRVGLVGLAMLAPWLLAITEVATVRVQEPFVLYRSYLWMSLLPAAIPAAVARLRPGWGLALLAAAGLALLPPFFDRLGSFSSEFKVWNDAVLKNTDSRAPFTDRAWRNRGVAQYKAGRYPEALADFNQALKLDARSALGWMTRGTLYMRAARSEEARADFDRALELDPRQAEALARRCVVLMRLKRLDAALADCLVAADLSPDHVDSYTSLGMVRALRGETLEAELQYRRALQLEPKDGDAHYQYGVLLGGLGRIAEARPHFAAACAAGVPPACKAAGAH